jgi:hypothetical protein
MTPDQYSDAIAALGLSQRAAGRFLKVGERTSRRWAAGDSPIAEEYGSDVLIRRLRVARRKKRAGRPKDLVFNMGIIGGHVEFLKRYRVRAAKRKEREASKMLAKILERYTAGVLVKSKDVRKHVAAKTIENIYKKAKGAAHSDPLLATVMTDTYNTLVHELTDAPEREAVPILVKRSGSGYDWPMFDTWRMDGIGQIIVHDGPHYRSAITFIVTPKKVSPKIST